HAIDQDFPFAERNQPGNQLHDGGFSAAVRSQQADNFAAWNAKADTLQYGMRAVALVKVGDLQDWKLRNRAALDRLIYCIAHIAFLSQKTIELDDGSGPCSQNVSDDNLEFPGKFSRFL